jgi:diphthamide biosynthesis enzyme Dph1/Dph2-like protein
MKDILYIDVKKKIDINNINLKALDSLPEGSISIGATVQYLDLIPIVKEYLEKKQRKVVLKQGAFYKSHVLGCNSSAFDKNCDVLLLITDGIFHAINNAISLNKEIYIFDCEKIQRIEKKEIDSYFKKLESKKKRFLSSKLIGLLVSNKSGQSTQNLLSLKTRIISTEKKVYVFYGDTIDINDFENYPEISIYVNCACIGLARDDPRIINLSDILEFLN